MFTHMGDTRVVIWGKWQKGQRTGIAGLEHALGKYLKA